MPAGDIEKGVDSVVIFSRVIRESFTDGVTFLQRPEGGEEGRLGDPWGKAIQRNSHCAPVQDRQTQCLQRPAGPCGWDSGREAEQGDVRFQAYQTSVSLWVLTGFRFLARLCLFFSLGNRKPLDGLCRGGAL